MTEADYKKILDLQGGVRAICKKSLNVDEVTPYAVKGRYDIDHDHSTGAVRGLLCKACNKGLGALRDSVEALKNALIYLTEKKKFSYHLTPGWKPWGSWSKKGKE